MRLGIVGHGDDKFTRSAAMRAISAIKAEIRHRAATTIVSGRSPLGGVDVWAETVGRAMGLNIDIKVPRVQAWAAPGGYKDRNLAIARDSDLVLVVVVDDFPPEYPPANRYFDYHCKRYGGELNHVKSGGCWTAWQAEKRAWRIVPNVLAAE